MLLKDHIELFTPGKAPNPGQPASTSCPPTPPPGTGPGGGGSGGGSSTNCFIVPIVTGHNPDGTPIVIGFVIECP